MHLLSKLELTVPYIPKSHFESVRFIFFCDLLVLPIIPV